MKPTESDAFDDFLTPPNDETTKERAARVAQEQAAKCVSAQIDANLWAEKMALSKGRQRAIHVLILGQSGSGTWSFYHSCNIDMLRSIDSSY